MTTLLPISLSSIGDHVIDNFYQKTQLSINIGELIKQYKTDAYDDLVFGRSNEELIVLNFSHFAWLIFSDSELIANQFSDEPITNKLRVKYTLQLISQTLENIDSYDFLTVHMLKLKKDDGNTAILGQTIETHCHDGPKPKKYEYDQWLT